MKIKKPKQPCKICNGITEWTQFLNGNLPNVKFNFCPVCGRPIK